MDDHNVRREEVFVISVQAAKGIVAGTDAQLCCCNHEREGYCNTTTSYNVSVCLSMSPARMRIHANYLRKKEYYDLCGNDVDKTYDFPDFIS